MTICLFWCLSRCLVCLVIVLSLLGLKLILWHQCALISPPSGRRHCVKKVWSLALVGETLPLPLSALSWLLSPNLVAVAAIRQGIGCLSTGHDMEEAFLLTCLRVFLARYGFHQDEPVVQSSAVEEAGDLEAPIHFMSMVSLCLCL
jgi:hypothetical protein